MEKVKIWKSIFVFFEIVIMLLLLMKGAERIIFSNNTPTLLVLGGIRDAIPLFFNKMKTEPSFIWKVIMFFKGIFIVASMLIICFHIFMHNIKDNTIWYHLLLIVKMIILYLFLFKGTAAALDQINSHKLFEMGNVFSKDLLVNTIDIKWLPMWILFFLGAGDLVIYHTVKAKNAKQ